MTEVTRGFCWHQNFIPCGCPPLTCGYIHLLNHEKMCLKSEVEEILFKLATNDHCHQNFGPNGLSAPTLGLCSNFFSWKTVDFNISSALRWAIQDQWSSGCYVGEGLAAVSYVNLFSQWIFPRTQVDIKICNPQYGKNINCQDMPFKKLVLNFFSAYTLKMLQNSASVRVSSVSFSVYGVRELLDHPSYILYSDFHWTLSCGTHGPMPQYFRCLF